MTREDIIAILKKNSASTVDLSVKINRPVSAIEEDLDHIRTSMKYDEKYKLLMMPAVCQLCDFRFSNTKIKAPTKCPECHREKISLPQFKINKK